MKSRGERTRTQVLRASPRGAEERGLNSQPQSGEIDVSGGRVGNSRLRRSLRWWYPTRRDGRSRPNQNRRERGNGRSDLTCRDLHDPQRLTASAMARSCAPIQALRRHRMVHMRVQSVLGWRLRHGSLVHAIAAGSGT